MDQLRLDLRLIDKSLAQDSLTQFVKQFWTAVEPATCLSWNWHFDLLCEYLEAVAAGEIKRLILNMPPRCGKSLLTSVLWPPWVWIKQPAARWLFASYSASLSLKHNTDRRTVLTSPTYQNRWPLDLAYDQNQKAEFMNAERGHMIATSLGGTVTGKGGDFIIVDDLQNPEMAESEIEREKVVRFFDETLSTRLDDVRRGRIVVVQQRTHQADLTGHLLEQVGWRHLSLPAEFLRTTAIPMPRTGGQVIREEGELLWPDRLGRAELDEAKARLGEFAYACQFLQAPIARSGNLFKRDWFGVFCGAPQFDRIVQSWDCAFKTGPTNDYSACVTIGVVENRRDDAAPGYYLLHAWHGKIEFVELKNLAIQFHQQWHSTEVLVEDSGSGQSLIQELRRQTSLPIKAVKPEGPKYVRATSVTPILGTVGLRLSENAPWSSDYLAEMTSYPAGAHDDFVDATVQALTCLRETVEPHILTHYREITGLTRGHSTRARESDLAQEGSVSIYELERRALNGLCHKCGKPLGTTTISAGPWRWHPECHPPL